MGAFLSPVKRSGLIWSLPAFSQLNILLVLPPPSSHFYEASQLIPGIKEALKDRNQTQLRAERVPLGECSSVVLWDYSGGQMLQKWDDRVPIWAEEITHSSVAHSHNSHPHFAYQNQSSNQALGMQHGSAGHCVGGRFKGENREIVISRRSFGFLQCGGGRWKGTGVTSTPMFLLRQHGRVHQLGIIELIQINYPLV